MKDRAHELKRNARDRRCEGELVHAGNLYTAAAHEYAGVVTEHRFPEPDLTYASVGAILHAATCYRVGGDQFRAANRCTMGTLQAEDYTEYIERQDIELGSFADVRRGAWFEYIGDLRTVARRDDADDAYEGAMTIYERCSNWEFVMGEQEHMALAAFFRDVKRGLEYDIPRDAPEQQSLDGRGFSDWLEYKRERLPGLLDELEAQGEWPTTSSNSENGG